MNFFNRALKNVQRKKTRTILLIVTFFVIGNFVILGLAISNAAADAKVATRQNMRAVVNYQVDYEKVWDFTKDFTEEENAEFKYPRITLEEINEFANDERIKTISINNYNMLYSEGLETVVIDNDSSNQNNGESCWTDEDGNEECHIYVEPNLNLKTNLFPSNIEIEDGIYNIVEGVMYTQDDIDNNARVCLITKELAELNGLKIGDSVNTFVSDPASVEEGGYAYGDMTKEDIHLELEIIGIFENTDTLDPTSDSYNWLPSNMAPGNVVLAPLTTISEFNFEFNLKNWNINKDKYPDEEYYQDPDNIPTFENFVYINMATILLNDPLQVDSFVADHSVGVEEQFKTFDTNNEMFEKLSKPLDTMSLFAKFIVWLVIINAIIIITLVTALTLKSREYEIGVLLSLGTSKFKIISQFFIELTIVALIGFTLANISGSVLANKVGDVVWSYQSQYDGVATLDDNSNNDMGWYGQADYFTEITYEDVSSNYQVSISPLLIGEIYIAGLAIVLIAILIPSMMIMRFSPKRILMSAQ
jgi:ABC-type antimicrobial peptide transport system permease subunit